MKRYRTEISLSNRIPILVAAASDGRSGEAEAVRSPSRGGGYVKGGGMVGGGGGGLVSGKGVDSWVYYDPF